MFGAVGPIDKVLWALIIVLVVGFLAGSWLNRQRSKAIGQWLQDGLVALGGRTTWKWLRGMNSGAQVTVEAASKPFRRLEISYFMLTRELLPLWGIEWLRGKRDLMAVRGELREAPKCEVEVVPAQGNLRQALDAHVEAGPITWEDGPHGLSIGARNGNASELAGRLRLFLERYGPAVQRLSLRSRQPNLVLFIHVSGLEGGTAGDFVRGLRKAVGD